MIERRELLGAITSGVLVTSGCLGNDHEQNQDGFRKEREYATTVSGEDVLYLRYSVDLAEGEWAVTTFNIDFAVDIYLDLEPGQGSMQTALGHLDEFGKYRNEGEANPQIYRQRSTERPETAKFTPDNLGTWGMAIDNTNYFNGFSPDGRTQGDLVLRVVAL